MKKLIYKLKKRRVYMALLAIVLVYGMMKAYSAWIGVTHIAFFNYQVIALGQISHANDNRMIELCEITTDDFDHLADYDMTKDRRKAT